MSKMITAEDGDTSELARRLLDIADELGVNRHSIRTTSDVSHSFIVPDEVADLYLQAIGEDEESGEEEPAKPKRGRPRKTQTED